MFEQIIGLYTTVCNLDLEKDKPQNYERIVYLALHKIMVNQIELINVRQYNRVLVIILLPLLVTVNDIFLKKFQTRNDIIVNDIIMEHHIMFDKFNEYNKRHLELVHNQREILIHNYVYQISSHSIKTRLLSSLFEIASLFVSIITSSSLNPIQFGCLLWFIDNIMHDMVDNIIKTTNEKNQAVLQMDTKTQFIINEFIDNQNIIYECMEEDSYFEIIKQNVKSVYDISKDISSSYKINSMHSTFESYYSIKVSLLNMIIYPSPLLIWIYSDIKTICNEFVVSLIAYNDIKSKIQTLRLEDLDASEIDELPKHVDFIDIKHLNLGVLFKFKPFEYCINDSVLFRVPQEIVLRSMKWITLTGVSGTGKTTFCNMLIKIIDQTNRNVYLLGKYNDYDYNQIRKYISYIKPNTDLFNKSIMFNLTFGVTKCIDIKPLLTQFGLEHLICSLDDDINRLSTGEKQRIKIIRCILQNKPIWIFDEITSNIDESCEIEIMNVLKQIQIERKKSVIHITHNVKLKQYCDCSLEIIDKNIILEDFTPHILKI